MAVDHQSKKNEKEKKRRVEDVGRVLKLLLHDQDSPPNDVANKLVDLDRFVFRSTAALEVGSRPPPSGLLSFRFFEGGLIRFGGTGIILQVENPNEPTIKYGLKFSRPTFSDTPQNENRLFTQLKREVLNHTPLLHRNIVRIFGTSQDALVEEGNRAGRFRPIMMEWIESRGTLNEFLKALLLNSREPELLRTLIDKIIQGFSALSYIHSKNIIHWDVKSDNFLVDKDGVLKLIDIGNARIKNDPAGDNVALTTRGRYPKALDGSRDPSRGIDSSSNRTKITLPHPDWDCPWLDMWMFSNSVIQLIREHEEPYEQSEDAERADKRDPKNRVTSSEREKILETLRSSEPEEADFKLDCLRLILRRILVPKTPHENRYYNFGQDVIADLEKIEPLFGAAQGVQELSGHPQNVMRLPIWGNVPYTTRIAGIYNSPGLRRLFSHYQLGPIHQVFPGATHRRSEHVAGVLAATCEYVRALYADKTNPFWRLSVEHKDITSLLLAALLHDVGHIAFGHFIEEMEGLSKERTHEEYAQAVLDPTRIDRIGKFADSETAAADRNYFLRQVVPNWQADRNDGAEGILARAAACLKLSESVSVGNPFGLYDRSACENLKIKVLHSILDSAIDADKFDYVQRDAHHCGVPYASGIDSERFFQALTVILKSDKAFGTIGVTEKGILPVESILIARYQLFRSVYWHHTVRAQTAMLQFLVIKYVTGLLDLDDPDITDTKEKSVTDALEKLIAEFREASDEDAIHLVRSALGRRIENPTLRKTLRHICDALLGNRSLLYKRILELNFEPGNASKEGLTTLEIYAALHKWSSELNESTHPIRYLRDIHVKRLVLTKIISSQIGVELGDGDVLLDVPPAGKDQVDDIFVAVNGSPTPMNEMSAMGKAVRDTFRDWTRTVRIFLSADALRKCEEKGSSRSALRGHAYASLQAFAKDLSIQK